MTQSLNSKEIQEELDLNFTETTIQEETKNEEEKRVKVSTPPKKKKSNKSKAKEGKIVFQKIINAKKRKEPFAENKEEKKEGLDEVSIQSLKKDVIQNVDLKIKEKKEKTASNSSNIRVHSSGVSNKMDRYIKEICKTITLSPPVSQNFLLKQTSLQLIHEILVKLGTQVIRGAAHICRELKSKTLSFSHIEFAYISITEDEETIKTVKEFLNVLFDSEKKKRGKKIQQNVVTKNNQETDVSKIIEPKIEEEEGEIEEEEEEEKVTTKEDEMEEETTQSDGEEDENNSINLENLEKKGEKKQETKKKSNKVSTTFWIPLERVKRIFFDSQPCLVTKEKEKFNKEKKGIVGFTLILKKILVDLLTFVQKGIAEKELGKSKNSRILIKPPHISVILSTSERFEKIFAVVPWRKILNELEQKAETKTIFKKMKIYSDKKQVFEGQPQTKPTKKKIKVAADEKE